MMLFSSPDCALTRGSGPFRPFTKRVVALSGQLLLMALADFFVRSTSGADYCVAWTRRDDVGTPGARGGHAMAYDRDRRVSATPSPMMKTCSGAS